MAHIPDLAPISYSELKGIIRAVGWLEADQPYPRGPVEPEFTRRLMALVARPISLFFSLGMHWCSLCEAEDKPGPDCRSSQAVLFVPGPECVYEAPIWIGHYVIQHSYQPPPEFCRAVLACPEAGSEEFARALGIHIPMFADQGSPSVDAGSPSIFAEWGDGAEQTLQSDPVYGSWKRVSLGLAELFGPPSNEAQRQKQLQTDLKFYDQLGAEDQNCPCKKAGCQRGVTRLSVFCRRHHFEQVCRRECPFDH